SSLAHMLKRFKCNEIQSSPLPVDPVHRDDFGVVSRRKISSAAKKSLWASFLCHSHAVFGQADHALSGDAREKRAIRGRRKNHTVLGNEDVGGSKLNREHQTRSPIN